MTQEVSMMASIQEKVRERIHSTFMDLLPKELFDAMVSDELNKFNTVELPKLVKKMAENAYTEALKAEFQKPEWQEKWTSQSGNQASDLVKTIIKEAAPDLVAQMFTMAAQNIVNNMRNAGQRLY